MHRSCVYLNTLRKLYRRATVYCHCITTQTGQKKSKERYSKLSKTSCTAKNTAVCNVEKKIKKTFQVARHRRHRKRQLYRPSSFVRRPNRGVDPIGGTTRATHIVRTNTPDVVLRYTLHHIILSRCCRSRASPHDFVLGPRPWIRQTVVVIKHCSFASRRLSATRRRAPPLDSLLLYSCEHRKRQLDGPYSRDGGVVWPASRARIRVGITAHAHTYSASLPRRAKR